jgi:(p)ppGpp synthase/HD superfamily hydrolase
MLAIELKSDGLIMKAYNYARKCHDGTNQEYDGNSYMVHVIGAFGYAAKYIDLISKPDRATVLAAVFAHDVIEDTRQTYGDVKKELGERVAEIVYAVTNEKGKNRKERANDVYYSRIRRKKNADFVKLCDRLSNVRYSVDHGASQAKMYRNENKLFVYEVTNRHGHLQPMISELYYLLSE